jgi:DNA-binding IclR family transcriptional regulator
VGRAAIGGGGQLWASLVPFRSVWWFRGVALLRLALQLYSTIARKGTWPIMDVKTASRTIEVFEAFAREQKPLTLTDLARHLDAPTSSCLYLVRTLEKLGYLYGLGARKNVYPTRKLMDVAIAIAQGEPWIDRIEPVLVNLRNESQETVILGKRQGTRVVYLAVYEGSQTIRYAARAGDLKPLHSSAIGKAMLGVLSKSDLNKMLEKIDLTAVTPNTITDDSKLVADIKKGTARGYTISRGENVHDVMAIAKAITLDTDNYGIAIAAPLYRLKDNIAIQVERLLAAASEAVDRCK